MKFGKPDIAEITKASRISWLGHPNRYKDTSFTMKVTFSTIGGKEEEEDLPLDGLTL